MSKNDMFICVIGFMVIYVVGIFTGFLCGKMQSEKQQKQQKIEQKQEDNVFKLV